MSATSPVWDLRGDDAGWQADPLPQVRAAVPSAVDPGWPDGPGLFDVAHDATARFYATNRGVTPCFLDAEEPADLQRHVPMGYTNLDLFEKRAVVADGVLVRLWPRRFDATPSGPYHFHLVVPGDGEHEMLVLGASHPVPYPILQAENLSARLGVPVLVARRLSSRAWH